MSERDREEEEEEEEGGGDTFTQRTVFQAKANCCIGDKQRSGDLATTVAPARRPRLAIVELRLVRRIGIFLVACRNLIFFSFSR